MVRISRNRIDLESGRIDRPVIRDYGETTVSANSSTSYTADLTNGNVFDITLTANCTFTFSNPTASGTSCSFTLYLTQDSTGGRTATWPAAVKWPSGTAPTLTTTAGRTDVLTFSTVNGGTTWFGFVAGQDMQVPPPASIAYISRPTIQTADQSTYTFTNASIGTAAASRVVMVHIVSRSAFSGTQTISSVTIGGTGATVYQVGGPDGSNQKICGLAVLAVPSGTTATVVVNYSGTVSDCAIDIFAAYDLLSATPTSTPVTSQADPSTSGSGFTVLSGGFGIGAIACLGNGATRTFTWSGATEEYDYQTVAWETSSSAIVASGFSGTVTATPSASITSLQGLFAAFR